MKTALVITSISPPNQVLRTCTEVCQTHRLDFIVVGGKKSPADFQLEGCDYWNLKSQRASGFAIAQTLPQGHYSRKNLGDLTAMERGAEVIIETDDDNLPLDGLWEERCKLQSARKVTTKGWGNPYRYFTDENIWPRGFPLEQIKNRLPTAEAATASLAPIQQGLTDGTSDVDAIYRRTRPLPITFQPELPLALTPGAKAPFNSQNTTWFKEAFPLLYLPSTCLLPAASG